MRILPTKEEVNTICMLVAIGMWVRIGWDYADGIGTDIRDKIVAPAIEKAVSAIKS